MQYTKLLVLSVVLLSVTGSVCAADMSGMEPRSSYEKNGTVYVKYFGQSRLMQYDPNEPVRELIKDVRAKFNIPLDREIALFHGPRRIDEDRLCGSFQGRDSFGNIGFLQAVIVPQ